MEQRDTYTACKAFAAAKSDDQPRQWGTNF
jgi:hypothetical protein